MAQFLICGNNLFKSVRLREKGAGALLSTVEDRLEHAIDHWSSGEDVNNTKGCERPLEGWRGWRLLPGCWSCHDG